MSDKKALKCLLIVICPNKAATHTYLLLLMKISNG